MSASVECADFVLDERQQFVFDALRERHADLASMYQAALRILASDVEDSHRRMRLALICHAMREVMNGFADAVGTNLSERVNPPASVQVQALPDLLTNHSDLGLDRVDLELIPVPQLVAAVFDKLIKTAVQEKRHRREIAAAMLTDDGNVEHPAVNQWMDARKFVVGWVHLEAKPTELGALPSDEDLRASIRVAEDLIEVVTKQFFDARRDVDDLLDVINRTEGGES